MVEHVVDVGGIPQGCPGVGGHIKHHLVILLPDIHDVGGVHHGLVLSLKVVMHCSVSEVNQVNLGGNVQNLKSVQEMAASTF